MQMVTKQPGQHRPLSDSVSSTTYRKLSTAEQQMIAMLEHFAPEADAAAWFCEYELLLRMGEKTPDNPNLRKVKIADDQLMNVIGGLVHARVIDTCIGTHGDRIVIWVSPYKYRARLRHSFVEHLRAEKTAHLERPATGGYAAA